MDSRLIPSVKERPSDGKYNQQPEHNSPVTHKDASRHIKTHFTGSSKRARTVRKDVQHMTNKQYFALENLKHKYNQKLEEAQEAHDEQEATYFSGVVNGIQIAARELLEDDED